MDPLFISMLPPRNLLCSPTYLRFLSAARFQRNETASTALSPTHRLKFSYGVCTHRPLPVAQIAADARHFMQIYATKRLPAAGAAAAEVSRSKHSKYDHLQIRKEQRCRLNKKKNTALLVARFPTKALPIFELSCSAARTCRER